MGGDSNQTDSDGTFVGSINNIIDDRVTEDYLTVPVRSLIDGSYLAPFIDSDVRQIVDRDYLSPIVDSDYIADRLDLNRFFDFATDSNGDTSLTLSDETIIRNINETVDSDYVIARMLPTVFSTVDSDYIKSKISLDELFTAVTGDSSADGESFLAGIEDIIDERVTSEYIAERFSVAAFIASVPDLPVDIDDSLSD